MTEIQYVVLAAGALIASTVSGISGVGGGMVYLPILAAVLGVKTAVPYLTVLLLVSNFSRAYFSRESIDWKVPPVYWIGAVPGAVAGALLFAVTPAVWIARAVGAYLLAYVGLSFTKEGWPRSASLKSIGIIGIPAGFVSAIVGGSGPVAAPYMLRYGLVKSAFIATEAVASTGLHVTKMAVWSGTGILGSRDFAILAPLSILMVVGSYVGKVLVERMPARFFHAMLVLILAGVGIRFLFFYP